MRAITNDMYDIMRCRAQYRASYMEQFGLKGCHANYIIALCEEPGSSQEQLARRIYADKSNIARQVAALEEHGYARREVDAEDKRVQHVYPTEKAKELLPLILEKQNCWDDFVIKELTDEELAQAGAVLKKMKQQADKFREKEF